MAAWLLGLAAEDLGVDAEGEDIEVERFWQGHGCLGPRPLIVEDVVFCNSVVLLPRPADSDVEGVECWQGQSISGCASLAPRFGC